MKVEWTHDAEADRGAIYDRIERDNPRAAIELDIQFGERSAQLASHPLIGRAGRVEGTRELVIRPNYLFIYQVLGDTVRIVRLLHAAQQWPPEQDMD